MKEKKVRGALTFPVCVMTQAVGTMSVKMADVLILLLINLVFHETALAIKLHLVK